MSQQKQSHLYYLYAISNFLAAFGGGMILGKGINVINISSLQTGSVLAFFIGTVLGLSFLQLIPEKFSSYFARWFSISGGLTSLILFSIFKNYSVDGQLTNGIASIFFILLCIRFGFWFYSRALRASNAAGQQQRIAWVELGYYSGMIIGLIIWKMIDIDINITMALLIDTALQLSAGALDIYASYASEIKTEEKKNVPQNTSAHIIHPEGKWWGLRLSSGVIFLTIGTQVIIFSLTHHVSEYFASYILASFYFGASIAAFICKKFNLQLEWKYTTNNTTGYANIFSEKQIARKTIGFLPLGIFSSFCVAMTILSINYWIEVNNGEYLILLFTFFSAFFYEILALAILDRIGLEEQKTFSKNKMILRTYGMMGISAAISLWIFSFTNSSLYGLLFTLGACLVLSMLAVWKRNVIA
jgi:hypothetical protein